MFHFHFMRRRFWKKQPTILLLLGVITWGLLDLYAPRHTNIRQFNPNEVGRLDAEMWRSYYNRQHLLLFWQLTQLLRNQYHAPFMRSNLIAYRAAKAAFVFKEGHNRQEYTKAVPYLIDFYLAIRAMSEEAFDAEEVANLELEWWIIHRQRSDQQPGDLAYALAQTASAIYHVPAEKLLKYAQLRAQAMEMRDAHAATLTEKDWIRIEQLLQASWLSLRKEVNKGL